MRQPQIAEIQLHFPTLRFDDDMDLNSDCSGGTPQSSPSPSVISEVGGNCEELTEDALEKRDSESKYFFYCDSNAHLYECSYAHDCYWLLVHPCALTVLLYIATSIPVNSASGILG